MRELNTEEQEEINHDRASKESKQKAKLEGLKKV